MSARKFPDVLQFVQVKKTQILHFCALKTFPLIPPCDLGANSRPRSLSRDLRAAKGLKKIYLFTHLKPIFIRPGHRPHYLQKTQLDVKNPSSH